MTLGLKRHIYGENNHIIYRYETNFYQVIKMSINFET